MRKSTYIKKVVKTKSGFTSTSEGQIVRLRAVSPSAVEANARRGFTLIETLVAITILLLAITGPITFAAKGIQNTYYARDQMTAFYLAQEGIELVRAARDSYALANTSGIASLNGSSCATATGCGVDVRSLAFTACTASDDSCRMYYDPAGLTGARGIYVMPGQPNTTATTFVRRIRILDDVSQPYERTVEAEVKWTTGSVTKVITVRSKIFDQYDRLF